MFIPGFVPMILRKVRKIFDYYKTNYNCIFYQISFNYIFVYLHLYIICFVSVYGQMNIFIYNIHIYFVKYNGL